MGFQTNSNLLMVNQGVLPSAVITAVAGSNSSIQLPPWEYTCHGTLSSPWVWTRPEISLLPTDSCKSNVMSLWWCIARKWQWSCHALSMVGPGAIYHIGKAHRAQKRGPYWSSSQIGNRILHLTEKAGRGILCQLGRQDTSLANTLTAASLQALKQRLQLSQVWILDW